MSADASRGAVVVATACLHFAARPEVFPQFLAWLNDSDLQPVTAEQVRRSLHTAHELLAPNCPEPIEVI